MSIRHHLNDDTLLNHAAGRLGAGVALLAEVHLHSCPHCRARLTALEALGGVLLDSLAPEALAPNAFAETLDRLELERAETPAPAAPPQTELALPSGMALPAALGGCEIGPWRWFGFGIRHAQVRLPWAPEANVMLLRVAANRPVLRHSHAGHELTQILQGGYHDCTGQYGPGDMAEGDAALLHQPHADAEGCICLAALEGSLRLDGWLGWLQRRFGA